MPIIEKDAWREQYFRGVACPADVFVPTDDMCAYQWYPQHRWIYNKLLIAESQGLTCAPHGIDPSAYPVFSKPIYNLQGMGIGGHIVRDAREYQRLCQPGHLWMTLLEGEHVSTDLAVVHGEVRWCRHAVGKASGKGTFDYWVIEADQRPGLEKYCAEWIARFLPDYTGMLNLETIGERIIEAHLRFADQWPDLYGPGWIDSVVELYSSGRWRYRGAPRSGFSVVLFGPRGGRYVPPSAQAIESALRLPGVTSVQITFNPEQPNASHAQPPGGFRLAVINSTDLRSGQTARSLLRREFGLAVRQLRSPRRRSLARA